MPCSCFVVATHACHGQHVHVPVCPLACSPASYDSETARKLWEVSSELVGSKVQVSA